MYHLLKDHETGGGERRKNQNTMGKVVMLVMITIEVQDFLSLLLMHRQIYHIVVFKIPQSLAQMEKIQNLKMVVLILLHLSNLILDLFQIVYQIKLNFQYQRIQKHLMARLKVHVLSFILLSHTYLNILYFLLFYFLHCVDIL